MLGLVELPFIAPFCGAPPAPAPLGAAHSAARLASLPLTGSLGCGSIAGSIASKLEGLGFENYSRRGGFYLIMGGVSL